MYSNSSDYGRGEPKKSYHNRHQCRIAMAVSLNNVRRISASTQKLNPASESRHLWRDSLAGF